METSLYGLFELAPDDILEIQAGDLQEFLRQQMMGAVNPGLTVITPEERLATQLPERDDQEVFCQIQWMRDDVLEAINLVSGTNLARGGEHANEVESIIDSVIAEVGKQLQDLSIERGWGIIDTLMPDDAIERAMALDPSIAPGDALVKDWYEHTYGVSEQTASLNPKVRFDDLLELTGRARIFNSLLGTWDQEVISRVISDLADRNGLSYSDLRNAYDAERSASGKSYQEAVLSSLRESGWKVRGNDVGDLFTLSYRSPQTDRELAVVLSMRGRDADNPDAWIQAAREAKTDDSVLWNGGTDSDNQDLVYHDIKQFNEGMRLKLPEIVRQAVVSVLPSGYNDNLVRDWYMRYHPEDRAGAMIASDLTFDDALRAVALGGGFYGALGVADSLVRNLVFEELAARTGLSYDDVYEAWLHETPVEPAFVSDVYCELDGTGRQESPSPIEEASPRPWWGDADRERAAESLWERPHEQGEETTPVL